jgi:hypothetical protein
MPTTITSSEVVTAFGSYYIDAGQNETNIHDTLREQLADLQDFTVVESEDTVLRESNVAYAEQLQSFQTAFTPKGGVTFTPKAITLFNVKIDQSFYPDAMKNQWLSFLTSNNLDRTTWPFVRWFIEKYVMGQITHDLVKNLYGASYVAPTAGTAGAASAAFDGLKKIINAAITAGTIVPIVTGAPNATASTWCTQVETFCKGIPELYWETPMGLQMSRSLALRFKEGRRTKYNSNYAQVNEQMAVQDFEQIQVAGRGSLTGTTKIWGTPKMNAIMAFKGGSNRNIVEVEKVDRMVKVYTDFWIGMGFINDALVFTNDQDLV